MDKITAITDLFRWQRFDAVHTKRDSFIPSRIGHKGSGDLAQLTANQPKFRNMTPSAES
jgi:hypothetical protein